MFIFTTMGSSVLYRTIYCWGENNLKITNPILYFNMSHKARWEFYFKWTPLKWPSVFLSQMLTLLVVEKERGFLLNCFCFGKVEDLTQLFLYSETSTYCWIISPPSRETKTALQASSHQKLIWFIMAQPIRPEIL